MNTIQSVEAFIVSDRLAVALALGQGLLLVALAILVPLALAWLLDRLRP